MRTLIMASLFALFALLATGCAEQTDPDRAVLAPAPQYFVPTTAMISTREKPLNAYALLPGSDGDLDFPRAEKGVYGSLPIGGASSFTILTYDAQRIGPRDSLGYQYRWVVQEGISAPLAP